METNQKHYGLGTAISMIVGILVGSGIFFKTDDILSFTGGSIGISVLVFFIAAFCVIFGSITISQLAARTDSEGGVVAYFEEFISTHSGSAFGWFQMFAYYPTIAVVVSWVAGIYTTVLLGLPATLELQVLIGVLYLIFFHALNYLSARGGGAFQNLATFLKLIPLLGIALIGIFWNQPQPVPPAELAVPITNVGAGWLAALAPTAFSFDGWIISTSITQEVKNAKRTMPIALTIGPLLVLVIYASYFLGIVNLAGPEYILALRDNAIYDIGQILMGPAGGQILLVFILIAVLGVVNGLVLGNIRLPHALAVKGMIPGSDRLKQVSETTQLSPRAALSSLGISLAWMAVHYLTQKTGMLAGGDVSEIAIVFSYVFYILLYLRVMRMRREGVIESNFFGTVLPVLAIIGSGIIVVGGIVSNPFYVPVFLLFCLFLSYAGYRYSRRHSVAS